MKDKIIQIIPAPKELTIEMQSYYDTGETREAGYSDKYGTPVYEEVEEPAFDDYGNPIYDEYPALCLALIEDENGDRSITPVFYDDDLYGTRNFELASDWNSFRGCYLRDESNDLTRITLQDNMGFIYVPEKTSHYLVQKNNGSYGINILINGNQIEVGEYNSKWAAELANEKIRYNSTTHIEMPSKKEMDEEVHKEQERIKCNKILGQLKEVFSVGTSRILVKAGYSSIDEVKSASDDELRERKVPKSCRDSIHRRLAKLAEKEAKHGPKGD